MLWEMGFSQTSSIEDNGLLLPQLMQIMNGFSGLFLIAALGLVALRVRRDR